MEMKKLILNTIILAVAFTGVLTSLSAREVNSDDPVTIGASCTECIYLSCNVSDVSCGTGCSGTWVDACSDTATGSPPVCKLKTTDASNPCSGPPKCADESWSENECLGC